MRNAETVLITGSSGLLGSSLIERLSGRFNLVGFDRAGPPYPPVAAECISADLTSAESIRRGLARVRFAYGGELAGVVHLAAYYDFSGARSDLYQTLTVDGTGELLRQLRAFKLGVFIFSSTMLVHRPCQPGERITEDSPLEGKWAYPESKIKAERVIREERGEFPGAALRIAGVYNDWGNSIPLAHQIRRIDAERFTSRVFPGDTSRGQAFVHLDDTVDAISACLERRGELRGFVPLLIGEPETMSYDELQREISRLLLGREIDTREISEAVARIGAWVQDLIPFGEDPFIKPWMVSLADDHYALDIGKAERVLGWRPRRGLRASLPGIIRALKRNPDRWYRENGLEPPPGAQSVEDRVAGKRA